ncbi:MAG: hypothetical protein M3O15_02570 [Acidobacteriota bacterium]|nr:hypothetical protein [Acidobacteriota bacterium]
MVRRSAERGEGNLGCILWALVLGVVVLVAVKMVPVKINSAELYDFMEEQSKFAANNSPEQIEKRILGRALELKLPLAKEQVKVQRVGDNIRMEATYDVPVEFPGYTYVWHFDHQIDRPIFIF